MTRFCLVVEDESPLGEMIRDNIVAEGIDADLARDGRTALERIERGGVDLVVLDVMLPELDGFEVLSRMRKAGDDTPVLILSARAGDADRIRGLELRADDYVTKPFVLRELMLRIRALLRRSTVAAGSAPSAPEESTESVDEPTTPQQQGATADELRVGEAVIFLRAHMAHGHDGERVALPESCIRLIRLLTSRPDEAVARREILDHLFGPATPTNSRTLDNLVAQLRRLFEPDSRNPRYLHTVRGVGYRFTPDS
jgi:two-component system alkaline phosphatase synthesis response regulator PhoP